MTAITVSLLYREPFALHVIWSILVQTSLERPIQRRTPCQKSKGERVVGLVYPLDQPQCH